MCSRGVGTGQTQSRAAARSKPWSSTSPRPAFSPALGGEEASVVGGVCGTGMRLKADGCPAREVLDGTHSGMQRRTSTPEGWARHVQPGPQPQP